MSSSTVEPSPGADQQAALENERFIHKQLNRTRSQLKMLELISSLLIMGTGLLTALLLLAIIDHWILPLGWLTRIVAWTLLVAGTVYATTRLIGPLLFRSITTTYAARSIEKQSPSLKNSLINFLLLRSQPQSLRRGMMSALGNQAATDLTLPHVDTDIDRSKLIKVGYLFVAILACCALYKMLSPKDPFQSFQRVMVPWAKIDHPTRVLIHDVQPGNLDQVYHGKTVDVSALVQGIDSDEPVTLVYTSLDGQIVDRRIPMQQSEQTMRFEAKLPAGESGIQQDLEYYLEAGDSRSPTYQVTVIPAPVIWITRVQYDYPKYTNIPPQTVTRQGDLEAIEGTQVTLFAETNQPIEHASVIFATKQNPDAKLLPMTAQQQAAEIPFLLQMNEDRSASEYHSYRLEFITTRQHQSEKPLVHRIEVTRDLPPEIEILQPQQRRLEVPVTASQIIEVRALDADFGLSRIALRAVAGETDILDHTLFEDQAGQSGQLIRRFNFRPAQLGLNPGDEVSLRAAAWDNRVSPQGQFEPQVTRTPIYTLVIIPGPEGNQLPDQPPESPQDPDDPNAPQKNGGEGKDDSQQPGGEKGSSGNDSDNQSDQGTGSPDQNNQGSKNPDKGNSGNTEGGTPGAADKAGKKPGEEPGDSNSQPNNPSENPGNDPAGNNNDPTEAKNGAGNQGSENKPQPGAEPNGESEETDDLHDGDIFERVLERMKRERQEKSDAQSNPTDKPSDSPDQQNGGDEKTDSNSKPDQAETGKGKPQPGEGQDQPDKPADAKGSPKPEDPQTPPKPGAKPTKQPGEKGEPAKQPGEKPAPKQPSDPKAGSKPDATPKENPNSSANKSDPAKPANGSKPDGKPKDANPSDSKDPNPQESSPADPKQDGKGSKSPGEEKGKGTEGTSGSGSNKPPVENGKNQSDEPAQGAKAAPRRESDKTNPNLKSSDPSDTGNSSDAGQDSSSEKSQRSGEGNGEKSDQHRSGGPQQELSDRLLDLPEDLPDNDEANLEYAKKATDLALRYLKDQQDDPNPDLLDELGVTAEELRAMVKRYEKLQMQAKQDGGESQVELDETLRSLGLRPVSRRRARRMQSPKETAGGLNEEAAESDLPTQFRKQFNAFKKGTSRSRD